MVMRTGLIFALKLKMGIRPRVYPPPPDNAQEFTKLEAGERLAERYPRFMFYTLAWFYPVIRTASKQGAPLQL